MSFFVSLISLSQVFLRFMHIVACIKMSFFFSLNNITLYVYTIFVYSFICGWTFGLFLPFGYCEECCCQHGCTNISLTLYHQFFGVYMQWIHMIILSLIFKGTAILSSTVHHFTYPSAMHEDSNFSTSLPTLAIFCLFDTSYPKRCEVG